MDVNTDFGRRSNSFSKVTSKALSLRSKKTTMSVRTLMEDSLNQLEAEPLDLLDQQKTRPALRSGGNLKRMLDSDDELEFDEEGRLIIREGEKVVVLLPSQRKPKSKEKCQNLGLTLEKNMLIRRLVEM